MSEERFIDDDEYKDHVVKLFSNYYDHLCMQPDLFKNVATDLGVLLHLAEKKNRELYMSCKTVTELLTHLYLDDAYILKKFTIRTLSNDDINNYIERKSLQKNLKH